jgi:hypothetical protein
MNRVTPVYGQPDGSKREIDRELKDEGLHPGSRAHRDSETRASREKIEPDQQAILALQRVSGAHIHRSNGLIHAYTNACYMGEAEMASGNCRRATRNEPCSDLSGDPSLPSGVTLFGSNSAEADI